MSDLGIEVAGSSAEEASGTAVTRMGDVFRGRDLSNIPAAEMSHYRAAVGNALEALQAAMGEHWDGIRDDIMQKVGHSTDPVVELVGEVGAWSIATPADTPQELKKAVLEAATQLEEATNAINLRLHGYNGPMINPAEGRAEDLREAVHRNGGFAVVGQENMGTFFRMMDPVGDSLDTIDRTIAEARKESPELAVRIEQAVHNTMGRANNVMAASVMADVIEERAGAGTTAELANYLESPQFAQEVNARSSGLIGETRAKVSAIEDHTHRGLGGAGQETADAAKAGEGGAKVVAEVAEEAAGHGGLKAAARVAGRVLEGAGKVVPALGVAMVGAGVALNRAEASELTDTYDKLAETNESLRDPGLKAKYNALLTQYVESGANPSLVAQAGQEANLDLRVQQLLAEHDVPKDVAEKLRPSTMLGLVGATVSPEFAQHVVANQRASATMEAYMDSLPSEAPSGASPELLKMVELKHHVMAADAAMKQAGGNLVGGVASQRQALEGAQAAFAAYYEEQKGSLPMTPEMQARAAARAVHDGNAGISPDAVEAQRVASSPGTTAAVRS